MSIDKSDGNYVIRPYQAKDENGWLRCRVLAFLSTAYFDDVCREKEQYKLQAIELVAEMDGRIVGLIDVECEEKSGVIWHLAVHPDYQHQGIGTALLARAKENAQRWGIDRFDAWTRDDKFVEQWYCSRGFKRLESYYHVYLNGREIEEFLRTDTPGLQPLSMFAHYAGNDAKILGRIKRFHKCSKYRLHFGKL